MPFDPARAKELDDDDFLLQTRPYVLEESVRLFPDAEKVFAEDVGLHAQHLDPAVSIDLSCVRPDLAGWVHIVLPREVDTVGMHTQPFHNDFVSENWVAFKVADDRYRFLGDFGFFTVQDDPRPEVPDYLRESWSKAGPVQRASYAERKQRYRASGWDSFRSTHPHPDTNDGPLYQFKDEAWEANWQQFPNPPPAFAISPSAGVCTSDDRELLFIASLELHHFRDDAYCGPNETLLYFDPVDSIAVQSFDWT